jgi:hypothetical protein
MDAMKLPYRSRSDGSNNLRIIVPPSPGASNKSVTAAGSSIWRKRSKTEDLRSILSRFDEIFDILAQFHACQCIRELMTHTGGHYSLSNRSVDYLHGIILPRLCLHTILVDKGRIIGCEIASTAVSV